jgi:hypothetical protein
MALPPAVWRCEAPRSDEVLSDRPSHFFGPSKTCYHPRHLVPSAVHDSTDLRHTPDPAAPHIALQLVSRVLLRNALALAYGLRRRLVLPRLWALCERHWWHLRDCRMPGVERLPLPYEAPLDLAFDPARWSAIKGVDFVGATFFQHARAPDVSASTLRLRIAPEVELGAPEGDAALMLPHGATVEHAAALVRGAPEVLPAAPEGSRLLEVDARSLLRLSACGFSSGATRDRFEREVAAHAFAGQCGTRSNPEHLPYPKRAPCLSGRYSHCSEERNPFVEALLREARAHGVPEESVLTTRRNCTGQPANAFNHPKVDLGAAALAFATSCDARACAGVASAGSSDGPVGGDCLDAVLAGALTVAGLSKQK